jgi:apolipoprotein N-acyltransferase
MLSIPRAIENKKFLIRSANTGISAIISPNGKIKEKLGTNKSGYLIGDVLLSSKKSFYLSNYEIINLFYYIIFFSLLALFYKKARNN